jgi:SAM-dependent MidA family methyltransferase
VSPTWRPGSATWPTSSRWPAVIRPERPPERGDRPTPLDEEVAARIRRRGPIPIDEVVELALYDPDHGFYAGAGGRAGRTDGDFITSPEVGPLFGAVVARALDAWWRADGEPDPFVVVEAGAGPGTLARTVLAAKPACAPALRYLLVERSAAQRERHGDHLALEQAAFAWPPQDPDEELDDARSAPATGPIAVSLADLPAARLPAVIIANELLDNLPFRVLERDADQWLEVLVGLTGDGLPLVEHLVPARADLAAAADRLATGAPIGGRIPIETPAADWIRGVLGLVTRGRVVAIDYADDTPSLARRPWTDWLRTFRRHQPGDGWLSQLGTQDITCVVATDQLARVRQPDEDRSQAEFLRAHGIDELVDEGRRTWTERAHLGDLAAVQARSRITEAEALLDPAGLGALRVLEWTV